MEEMKKKINNLKDKKEDEAAELQQWELNARMLKKNYEKADKETQEVAAALNNSLDSHIKKLSKAVKVLESLCVEEIDESKLPVFLNQLEALENDEARIQKWAVMFGLDNPKSRKRRRTTA